MSLYLADKPVSASLGNRLDKARTGSVHGRRSQPALRVSDDADADAVDMPALARPTVPRRLNGLVCCPASSSAPSTSNCQVLCIGQCGLASQAGRWS